MPNNKKRGLAAADKKTRERVAKMGGEARGEQRQKEGGDEQYFHELRGSSGGNQGSSGQGRNQSGGQEGNQGSEEGNQSGQGSSNMDDQGSFGSFGGDDNDR